MATSLTCLNRPMPTKLTCLLRPVAFSLICLNRPTTGVRLMCHKQRMTFALICFKQPLASYLSQTGLTNVFCSDRFMASSLICRNQSRSYSPSCFKRPKTSTFTCLNNRIFSNTMFTSPSQITDIKEFKDIPGPEGLSQWPVIGTVLNFKPFTKFTVWDLHEFLASLITHYGPIVRFQFAGPTVLLSDPRDAEVLFQNEGRYPIRPPIDLGDLYCKRNNILGGFNETPQQGDLRLSGPPSGQGAGGGARTRDRMVPADLRADSLATVPPTPPPAME
ncbi:cytochrome p450 cyp12a2 [Plakobranchus ocellatus]|uniref:Cytochrome p450 cyp12a2 n=1 Tax=Plakobranchus ocellatus TaxID=259542 RepID=A0AAV3Y8T2_9GAST|nr:cytochrome p450 cyp12a2 [Plakobranchus ocellatus]